MLGRRSPADIGRRKKCGNEHPWVIEDPIGAHRIDLRSDIGAAADAPQPTLLGPAREPLSRSYSVKAESSYDIIDVDNIARRGQHSHKLGAASGKVVMRLFHMLQFAGFAKYGILSNRCGRDCLLRR